MVEFDGYTIAIGIVLVSLGLAIYLPNDSLQNVASTEGEDIRQLMTSFSELNRGWFLLLVGIILLTVNSVLKLVENIY